MSEQNKALVRRMVEEFWSKGRLEYAADFFAKEYVRHDPPGPDIRGLSSLTEFAGIYRRAFPDLRFTIDELIAEGDLLAARWTGTGTQRGDLPGVPATGRQSTVSGITLSRIRNGKIEEEWVAWDQLGMLRNLGAIPAPTQPPARR
jgi:steroid delta-isomerase-like uncharacterized protein